MLAVLFVLGLIGYAVIYTGLAAMGTGVSPGILESLSPGFAGADLRSGRTTPSSATTATGAGALPGLRGQGQLTAPLVALLGIIRPFVAARYPGRRLVISSTYRPGAIVAGTSSASEHAFGNAADLRIERGGRLDTRAMDGLYTFLKATPTCELCWNRQGGCTTSHTDHLHVAPSPCRAG